VHRVANLAVTQLQTMFFPDGDLLMGVCSGSSSRASVLIASRLVSTRLSHGAFRTDRQFVVFTRQTLWLLPITARAIRRQTFQAMNGLAWGADRSSWIGA